MSDVKWIKVAVDMFDHDKIDFLRSLPEGDSIIVTWIQMLTIAGKSNNGGYLMVTDRIPYTEQLLSNKLRRQPVFLQFALKTLESLNMINFEDGPFHITNWEKHQNANGLEKIRSKTAERVAKHRKLKKEQALALQCNVTNPLHVSDSNETEVRSKNKEKDTTLLNRDFDKVKNEYEILHQVHEMPYSNSMLLIKLLEDGFSADTIIGIMKEKKKPSVKTLKFYEAAIRETAAASSTGSARKAKGQHNYYVPPGEYEAQQAARMAQLRKEDKPMSYEPVFDIGGA